VGVVFVLGVCAEEAVGERRRRGGGVSICSAGMGSEHGTLWAWCLFWGSALKRRWGRAQRGSGVIIHSTGMGSERGVAGVVFILVVCTEEVAGESGMAWAAALALCTYPRCLDVE
jgi:hypothetical protein